MDQNKLDGIVKKRIRDQRNSDRLLKVFVAVFFLGNIFFFSSWLTLPQVYKNVEASDVGTELELGDQIVTFDAWGYSKKDRQFEILIEVENLSLSGDPAIDFSCKCGEEFCPVTVEKIIDNNLYVLRVKKVPRRFSTASLTISTINDEGEEAYGKFYVTDKTVSDISSATSDNEYLLYAAECKIKGYKAQIRRLSKEEEELTEKINNSVSTIDELEEKKKLQTEAEQEETNLMIGKVSAEAERLKGELEDIAIEKAELQEKVKIQKEIIRKLEGGESS